jgi:type IV pilus assembly protein PilO
VKEVALARSKARKLKGLRAELEKRRVEYNVVMNALPDSKEIPGLLSSVSASAKESGLSLLGITPGKEVEKEFYSEIPISIDIRGDYHQIALFFDKVSRFTRVVDMKTANMQLEKDGLINVECDAVTYRFLKKNLQQKKEFTEKKEDKVK